MIVRFGLSCWEQEKLFLTPVKIWRVGAIADHATLAQSDGLYRVPVVTDEAVLFRTIGLEDIVNYQMGMI